MVVDLEMPKLNGLELLNAPKHDDRTRGIPVPIITTVTALEAVKEFGLMSVAARDPCSRFGG